MSEEYKEIGAGLKARPASEKEHEALSSVIPLIISLLAASTDGDTHVMISGLINAVAMMAVQHQPDDVPDARLIDQLQVAFAKTFEHCKAQKGRDGATLQ